MDIDIDSLKELCSQEILDDLITISRKESDPNIHFANIMAISRYSISRLKLVEYLGL